MTNKEFKKFVKKSFYVNFSSEMEKLLYLVTAINEEAGEIAGEMKKTFRDDEKKVSNKRKEKILTEAGDLIFYLTYLFEHFNVSLKDIYDLELKKLKGKKGEK